MKKIQTRGRKSAVDRKDQILSAALELIKTEGWAGASVEKIATKSHTSPSNIIYHFSDRTALLKSLLKRVTGNNHKIVEEGMLPKHDAFERLNIHFRMNLDWARRHPAEALVILQIYIESASGTEFSKIFPEMTERAQQRIEEYLLAGQRENIFHFTMNPKMLAVFLHDLLVGAFIKILGLQHRKPLYSGENWETILKNVTAYRPR